MSSGPGTISAGQKRRLGACLALLLGLLLAGADGALAQDEPRFIVRSAYTDLIDGVYYLNALIAYRLPESAVEALQSGVALTVEVQIEMTRMRRFLLDKEIAELKQRYRLEYHALSQRYVVRNLNSGEQESYPSLPMAMESIGQLRKLPLLDASLLEPGKRYEIRLRAVLDIRRLPVPLRLFPFFFDEWRLTSEWFVWRIRARS